MSDHFDEIVSSYDGDDQELRLMIEQRAALASLQMSPAWQSYRDACYSRLGPVQRNMMLGRYDSLETYREDVGFVKGMTEAVDGTLLRMENAIAARMAALSSGGESDDPYEYALDSPAQGAE